MRTTCKSQRFLVWLASQSPSETSCCLVGIRGLAELLGVGGAAAAGGSPTPPGTTRRSVVGKRSPTHSVRPGVLQLLSA